MKSKTKKTKSENGDKPIDASWEQIREWARIICAGGDDGDRKTEAFLLLMEEINRAQFDRLRVYLITFDAMQAGFAFGDQASELLHNLVKGLRSQAGLSSSDRPKVERGAQ
jgi:hypothetical protein